MKMKLDEDLGRDRGDDDQFQTDDEENQAERVFDLEGVDTESDVDTLPSRHDSGNDIIDDDMPAWPQSYRQSIDMYTSVTPPNVNFLRGSGLVKRSTSSLSAFKTQQQASESDTLLRNHLLSETCLNQEASTPTFRSSSLLYSKPSIRELPPPQKQCSFAQATLNGINVLCGIGLLTTPYAIKEGGWLSLMLLVMFGVICCYTGILLKCCLESTQGLETYPDIGQAAFGKAGRLAIAILLYMELYAASVEFITMISDNWASLYPNTSISFGGIQLDSHQTFAISAALLILPTVWLRNLSLLSYLSVGGVIASILVALCLLWVGVVNKVGFHPGGTALDLTNFSVSIGIYGYSYSGHSVFPNIYSSMKEPSQFPHVLFTSFLFCFLMYIGVAVCGFLMFGNSTQSQFTLNMPKQLVASKIATWTMVVNPITKYALTITPVMLSLEELLPLALRESYSVSLIMRTILVFSTLIVSLTVPYFGSVMALIGSMLAMLVALIFPCACYLRLFKHRVTKLQIAVCIFIMIVGLVCSCIGTFSAIRRIAEKMA
ncbi:amino acid transporter AVT1E [Ziziphus jujuba]|uniref:Amino acid transporter AVT1E n=1 Tax=Ziziphus jujuba TaxID=326968 RepID=A0ABM3I4C0_ZIZJJ|nr:amino acid transporter AVT1E [Ziziphus jujuba]